VSLPRLGRGSRIAACHVHYRSAERDPPDAAKEHAFAIQVTGASATLTNCVVTNNTATALYVTSSGSLTLSGSTISNNNGTTGPGGMWVDFSNVVVSNNTTFSSNSGVLGGAAYIYTASDDTHTDSITGSTFSLNTSTNSGGALYIGSDTVTIDSSTFNGNATARGLYGGGAIHTTALGAGTVITNSTFTGNQANAVRRQRRGHLRAEPGLVHVDDEYAAAHDDHDAPRRGLWQRARRGDVRLDRLPARRAARPGDRRVRPRRLRAEARPEPVEGKG
jgi:parallel beta-helix repeat protein/predicted outer membrane repeat protein